MQWFEIRQVYPNEWLIIEALQAHTTSTDQRQLDRIDVVERCTDGKNALLRYRFLHQQYPMREFYFVHTSRDELDIRKQQSLGFRRSHAVIVEG